MGKPPDLNIVSTDDTLNNEGRRRELEAASPPELPGTTPTPTGAVDTTMHNIDPGLETDLQPTAGQSPTTMRELPDHDILTILQHLPPGWVQGQGFTEGLHPSTDVFDQEDQQPDGAPQQSACDNGEEAGPELGEVSPCDNGAGGLLQHLQEGTHPDAPDSKWPHRKKVMSRGIPLETAEASAVFPNQRENPLNSPHSNALDYMKFCAPETPMESCLMDWTDVRPTTRCGKHIGKG